MVTLAPWLAGSGANEWGLDSTMDGKPEKTVPDTGAAVEPPPPQPPSEAFSLWQTFKELPWHVVPFLFGMFALVEALQQGGWVDFFAGVRRFPPCPTYCELPTIYIGLG